MDPFTSHRERVAADLASLDEPVRRYFEHALGHASAADSAIGLTLAGRIRLGLWWPFMAIWQGDGLSFRWQASCGPRSWRAFRALGYFADGESSAELQVGRRRVSHSGGLDMARESAGRAAGEAVWTPARLLPSRGVEWHAVSGSEIVATWDVPPERPELHLRIDERGAVRSGTFERWRAGHGRAGRYVPCGFDVHDERTFSGVTIPTTMSIGWWHGTPRFRPFLKFDVLAGVPLG